jgi:hypothetical protein
VREKYCWLVADKPSEQGVQLNEASVIHSSKVLLPQVTGMHCIPGNYVKEPLWQKSVKEPT